MATTEKIYIVGIGDDGLEGMTAAARELVENADLLIGEESTLVDNVKAEKFVVSGNLDAAVDRLTAGSDKRIVVLASGDPLFYGFARYLCDRLGKERFEVLPHVSSMQLAFARVKESWEEAYLTNLASHALESVVDKVRIMNKVTCLPATNVRPRRLPKPC